MSRSVTRPRLALSNWSASSGDPQRSARSPAIRPLASPIPVAPLGPFAQVSATQQNRAQGAVCVLSPRSDVPVGGTVGAPPIR